MWGCTIRRVRYKPRSTVWVGERSRSRTTAAAGPAERIPPVWEGERPMAQGLRRRPARIRRLGIGLVVLGAAVGCAGPDKTPSASLPSSLPPPRLPAATTTTTPKAASPAATTIDNRISNSAALPVTDPASALNGMPNPSRGQAGMISAPVVPGSAGNFRSQPATTPPANSSGGTWSPGGTPVVSPVSTIPELPAPGGLKNPSPTDVPQPPGPPVTSVTPPTVTPGAAPALPTGLPKP